MTFGVISIQFNVPYNHFAEPEAIIRLFKSMYWSGFIANSGYVQLLKLILASLMY